jgi:hypothetical protein
MICGVYSELELGGPCSIIGIQVWCSSFEGSMPVSLSKRLWLRRTMQTCVLFTSMLNLHIWLHMVHDVLSLLVHHLRLLMLGMHQRHLT